MRHAAKRVLQCLAIGSLIAALQGATAQAAQYTLIDLGTLGGNFSTATSVNSYNAVVGWSRDAAGHSRPP